MGALKLPAYGKALQDRATNLRRDTEQQNDSLNAKKSVIPAGMPESSHTPALSAAEGDVKL